jgi:hypothetical protein
MFPGANADNDAMEETIKITLDRINELRNTPNLYLDGNAYKGKYELNRKSIQKYLFSLRESLKVKPVSNPALNGNIQLSSRGIREITSWGMKEKVYMKTIAYIPEMIENATLIKEHEKSRKSSSHYPYFTNLVVGIELESKPYTVRIELGENRGIWYYSHFITEIEKGRIIDGILRPKQGGQYSPFPIIKDTTLIEILQVPALPKK